jgi:hypothetical protein
MNLLDEFINGIIRSHVGQGLMLSDKKQIVFISMKSDRILHVVTWPIFRLLYLNK